MTDEELQKIGEWLNRWGFDLDLNDDLWMEDWIGSEHKFRDIAEMLHDYAKQAIAERMPTELIKVQQEYIEFLGKELGDAAIFQHIHNIHASNEVINRGVRFREIIKRLDDEFRSRMEEKK
jgi:hypothetical protein